MIVASREDVAEQLWLRDEPELAERMLDTDDATYQRVMERAGDWRSSSLRHDTLDELLVASAVQILDGRKKPRRWRPRSDLSLSLFWARVGPDRDMRDPNDPVEWLRRVPGLLEPDADPQTPWSG